MTYEEAAALTTIHIEDPSADPFTLPTVVTTDTFEVTRG